MHVPGERRAAAARRPSAKPRARVRPSTEVTLRGHIRCRRGNAAKMTDTAIRTERLSKDYGAGRGLFELDLEIERGEVFGFLGPNGAGKSTTMRLLLDLITPTSGSAALLGLDSHRHSLEIRRRVGFLPGDFALYPKLPGAAILDYFAELRGGINPADPQRLGRSLRCRTRPAGTRAVDRKPAKARAHPGVHARTGAADPR